jgi:DNA-binding NtrC family response regulator
LVESDKGVGLESTLREQGCSVRRATSRAAAQEALETSDIVVISAVTFSAEEVVDLAGRATSHAVVLVVTDNVELAVKAAKIGANTVTSGSVELAAAQITQLLAVVKLKRRVA